jgi:hypothetical protein
LVVRQRSSGAFLVKRLCAKAVRSQSFERRRSGLLERNIQLLHRSQRFAQLAAQLRGRPAQRVQHLLLRRRRHLLLGQRVSAPAIHRLQSQHVLAAQTANRSSKVGFAACALAKFAGYLGREFRVSRTGHQLQILRHFAVGKHIQERRLPQGNVERRLQRVVEDRIAGGVGEITEHDRVFLGKRLSLASKIEPRAHR